MHLFIIDQYLGRSEQKQTRFYRLGSQLAASGYQVTVLATASGMAVDLGRKKICLLHEAGMNLVVLNAAYDLKMKKMKKLLAYIKFACWAGKQGRQLPKPELIIAASPPLTAVVPAIRLSNHFSVPLIVEIRELWPDAPVQRGSLKFKPSIAAARWLEKKVYSRADCLVAAADGIADAISEHALGRSKVKLIADMEDDRILVQKYREVIKDLHKYTRDIKRAGREEKR